MVYFLRKITINENNIIAAHAAHLNVYKSRRNTNTQFLVREEPRAAPEAEQSGAERSGATGAFFARRRPQRPRWQAWSSTSCGPPPCGRWRVSREIALAKFCGALKARSRISSYYCKFSRYILTKVHLYGGWFKDDTVSQICFEILLNIASAFHIFTIQISAILIYLAHHITYTNTLINYVSLIYTCIQNLSQEQKSFLINANCC